MSKGLEALEKIKQTIALKNDGYINLFETLDFITIEKELKALNEILILYNKWLGNEISDFEFFTLLNEITTKYDLLKEVLL